MRYSASISLANMLFVIDGVTHTVGHDGRPGLSEPLGFQMHSIAASSHFFDCEFDTAEGKPRWS